MKSWKAKLYFQNEEDKLRIDNCIYQWNRRLSVLCSFLMECRQGKYGQVGEEIFSIAVSGTHGADILDKLSDPNAKKPSTDNNNEKTLQKHTQADIFKKQFGVLASLRSAREGIPSNIWFQMRSVACSKLSSYHELHAQWKENYKTAAENFEKFKLDNPLFMAVLPVIEEFKKTHGSIERRNRNVKFINFLLNNSKIVNWQNDGSNAQHPTDDEILQTKKSLRHAADRYVKLIQSKNPSLKCLFNKLSEYRRCEKMLHRSPSYTLPSSNRPDWPVFQCDVGYKDLHSKRNQVKIAIENDVKGIKWVVANFVPDNRLRSLRKLEKAVKIGRAVYSFELITNNGEIILAQAQRLTIMKENGDLYAMFSMALSDADGQIEKLQKLQQRLDKTYSQEKIQKLLSETFGEFRTCAIDQGVNHNGALTVAEKDGNIVDRLVLKNKITLRNGCNISLPSKNEIKQKYIEISACRSKTGMMPKGKTSLNKHQRRYNNLRDARVKESVVASLKYAQYHGCKVVIIERLENLQASQGMGRGLNRSMNMWSRGQFVRWMKHLAAYYGIVVVEVFPAFSSRVCPTCNKFGVRFSVSKHKKREKQFAFNCGYAEFDRCGKNFYCPNCVKELNADLVASENLQRIFRASFPKVSGKNFDWQHLESVAKSKLELASEKDASYS